MLFCKSATFHSQAKQSWLQVLEKSRRQRCPTKLLLLQNLAAMLFFWAVSDDTHSRILLESLQRANVNMSTSKLYRESIRLLHSYVYQKAERIVLWSIQAAMPMYRLNLFEKKKIFLIRLNIVLCSWKFRRKRFVKSKSFAKSTASNDSQSFSNERERSDRHRRSSTFLFRMRTRRHIFWASTVLPKPIRINFKAFAAAFNRDHDCYIRQRWLLIGQAG